MQDEGVESSTSPKETEQPDTQKRTEQKEEPASEGRNLRRLLAPCAVLLVLLALCAAITTKNAAILQADAIGLPVILVFAYYFPKK
jgi:hypothetical protein